MQAAHSALAAHSSIIRQRSTQLRDYFAELTEHLPAVHGAMSLDDDRELLEAIAWRLTAKVADLRFDPERPLQERMQMAFPYALQELQDVAERLLPEDCEWAAQKQGEKKEDKPKAEGEKKDKPKAEGEKKDDKPKAEGSKKRAAGST